MPALRLCAADQQPKGVAPKANAGPNTTPPVMVVPPLLLSARDLAHLLRVSTATIWRLRAAGKLPRPLDSLGKQLLRWDASEVQRWVQAGMPDLKTWQVLTGQ